MEEIKISESLLEFYDDVNRMIDLYKNDKYTEAGNLRDYLAEELDNVMRLGKLK